MRFNNGKIKELRERNDMSLRAFARELGVKYETVRLWEANRMSPGAQRVARSCSKFNVEPGFFFEREEAA